MCETLLCIPPDYDHNYPPLGTPALSAYLKKNNAACSQIDLNLRYRDFLAQRVSGSAALSPEEQKFFLEHLLKKFFSEKLKHRYYSSFLPRGTDGFSSHIPYDNNTNSSFYFCERMISSGHLWQYLEDKDENTFLQYYEENGVLDSLDSDGIRLLGISVTSPTQVIASLTLGSLVKRRYPHIHVTIGGQWPTLYRDAILKKKELFRCFDSVVLFDGESALLALAQRLRAGEDISSIPNILTAKTAAASGTIPVCEDMDLLPCPDFDGLPVNDYDGKKNGKVSLTFETSRGCYWSKCAYCVDLPLPKPSYRQKRFDLVVRDMKELKDRYNAQYLLFGDPGMSPRQMRQISRCMLESGVKMEWWTMARLDPGFNRELFDLAYAAGLRQVNFGFESACDRVCGLLDKGNTAARSARVIRNCSLAGIKVDLQTMVGLPGESFKDGMETIDFLLTNKEFIYHVTFNTYYLTPSNYVHRNPEKYGIEFDEQPELPFRFFIPFKNKSGMDVDHANALEKIYYSLVNKKEGTEGLCGKGASGRLSEGHVEFGLLGESCRLKYRHDPLTDVYTFIQDEDA